MTTLTKKKLLDELKDKETRELFVEEHVTTGIPFQIHALREKLGLTQTELAKRAGMAPERISVLEDPNYEFIPKIPTLLKLANVFDVPLIVRFGSWRNLFEWETQLSPADLAPATFEEELEDLEFAAVANTALWTWNTDHEFTVTNYHTTKSIELPDDIDVWGAVFPEFTLHDARLPGATWRRPPVVVAPVRSFALSVLQVEDVTIDEWPELADVWMTHDPVIDSTSTYPM